MERTSAMSDRLLNLAMATAGLVAVLTLAPVSAFAQPPAPPQAGGPGGGKPPAGGGVPSFFGGPRHVPGGPVQHLADGHPDMQGFWNASNNGGAVFELQNHPTPRSGVPPGKGAIVDPADGFLPYQPWAAAKAKDTFEHNLAEEPELHCYESGVPKAMYVQFGLQIFQPANYVVLTWEFMHAYRIIPTDGRPHIPSNIKLFMGDSVGHWEGDTLVVDTTNLNDRTWYDTVGDFHSDAEHVVERFTPVDTTTIKYEATVEDPKVLTKPFKIAMELDKNTTPDYEQMEFGCIEGNQDVKHYTKDKGGAADVKLK
jgi:hypothetical protein